MAKRKRQRPRNHLEHDTNQLKPAQSVSTTNAVKQSVLEQFYPRVVTLREYLLGRLPTESKIRRKKVATAGVTKFTASASASNDSGAHDLLLKRMLDTTLIGVPLSEACAADREDKWTAHVSTAHDNSEITCGSMLTDTRYSQTEIVDFVIWLLFLGARLGSWNKHMLCQGYRRGPAFNRHHSRVLNSSIGGLSRLYENQYVEDLKSSTWPEILRLLGRGGNLIMIDLLVDCAIFRQVESGRGNYYQISGLPLGDLKTLDPPPAKLELTAASRSFVAAKPDEKTPAAILFVRNRFLYARPVLNSRGAVTFGLRHTHVLNRFPYESVNSDEREDGQGETQCLSKIHPNSAHVMMYIFPRQFGLHNVFTSTLDTRETVQPFKDYTVRDDEIKARGNGTKNKVPKRLRGEAAELAQKLQILHQRCPYDALLRYYCSPVERPTFSSSHDTTIESSEIFKTQKPPSLSKIRIPKSDDPLLKIETPKVNVIGHATPVAHVSAFCRSVLSRIIPDKVWGVGEDQVHNKKVLLQNVERFVQLRRFESMSLHDVAQGIMLSAIPWLASHNKTAKGCQSDTQKRQELFLEFLYYVFDSLLIPLIRCNFHVTESSVHRYRIFFFRHDIWRSLAEPAMSKIKHSMFEELDTATALRILDTRKLGFSQLRLLPKENGVRPILNLRRRPQKKGTKVLGQSINSILAPVYNMLTYEKEQAPQKFGSTLFSVGDLYHKLKTFKASLGDSTTRFYLCKVDVQSAFDTIPQDAVVGLAAELPVNSRYEFSKHVEVKPGDGHGLSIPGAKRAKPSRKWVSFANTRKDALPFAARVEKIIGPKRTNTVFVGNVGVQTHSKNDLVSLLTEHVQRNLVKIGKKYYRQKNGIPQGSVLSSLLCNYFYADLETKHLSFLNPKESLLLRLIDDFLLISTNPAHAKRFLQIMHNGVPDYGVTVSPHKTLVNFEIKINNQKLTRLIGSQAFPYCGALINTRTLHISKNRSSRPDTVIADSLTVEYSRQPGQTFTRKVLNTFKIQAHAMFLDTSHNSAFVVSRNLYEIFEESANKMVAYIKCLPRDKRPGEGLVKKALERLEELAWVLIRSKAQTGNGKEAGFRCRLRRDEACWLCWMAFRKVLGERQSAFGGVVEWLELQLEGPKVRKFRDRRPPL